jgi:hypothetical protein
MNGDGGHVIRCADDLAGDGRVHRDRLI